MSDRSSRTRIYIGNLPPDIRERDIEDIFHKYGRIQNIDLRSKKGPPFAFLDFEDERDAEDAIHGRDGYDYDGYRLRVEFPRPYRADFRDGRGGGRFNGGRSDRGDRGGGRYGSRGGYGGGTRRSKYRVYIQGIPPSGSWQDLKDHMREAGDVCYADVYKDGSGVVEYLRYEDMKYALKKLDDSKFRSHEGETSYVRVKGEEEGAGGRSRSRSASKSRSRSPRSRGSRSPSPARKRSRSPIGRGRASPKYSPDTKKRNASASRSRSPSERASRSPTKSPSKSPRPRTKSPASRSVSREP